MLTLFFLLFGILMSASCVAEETHPGLGTNIPTVYLDTKDQQLPYDKEHDIPTLITIVDTDGTQLTADSGGIRYRGNASLEFPKKPYRIKFDKKQKVLDAPAKAKKWTLINNYGDKTLMRNMVAFYLSRRFGMPYTPYCQPVDVVLNGEYRGCYQLSDQIEVNSNRVDITEMEPTDISGEALTGGYLIEIDALYQSEPCYFFSKHGIPVTIKSPDSDEITGEQKQYITDRFNLLEQKLFGKDFKDEVNGYRSMLDLNTFLRHFLVGELAGNTDTYWSVYMYKQRGDDRFYTGPVWDFDIAFDNDVRTFPICDKKDFLYLTGGSSAGKMNMFVTQIIKKDAAAYKQLQQIWYDARDSHAICADSILAYIDSVAKVLEPSQQLNFKKWRILSTKVHQNPRAAGTYAGEVQYLKDYIPQRIQWLDTYFEYNPETAVPGLRLTPIPLVDKVMQDGKIHIIKDNHYYDILGNQLYE